MLRATELIPQKQAAVSGTSSGWLDETKVVHGAKDEDVIERIVVEQ